MSTKKNSQVEETTYSDALATCVRASRNVESLGKTITKFALKSEQIVDVWSFAGEPHEVALGSKCLLRVARKPDGHVFYNLQ